MASQALAFHLSRSLQANRKVLLEQSIHPTVRVLSVYSFHQRITTYAKDSNALGGMTKDLLEGLIGFAKAIPVKGESIEVLKTPTEFLEVLKDGVRNARERVLMASLYIGTGNLERELVDVIADSLTRNPSLRVTLLFDALRTTRPSQDPSDIYSSSAAMLADLLLSDSATWRSNTGGKHVERLQVALYHTPELKQAFKWVLPARLKEVVGVCHIKAFIFDDTVVISGANLSTSYFTQRQDRYLCFPNCKPLAAHFSSLIDLVASFSYTLDMAGKLHLHGSQLDPLVNPVAFRSEMAHAVSELLLPPPTSPTIGEGVDTWLFPTVQMGPLGIRQDEDAILWLLNQLPSGTDIHLSSPYFNLTAAYEAALLEAATNKHVKILTASPKANGFYGSKGLSGWIPRAYSLLEESLHERAQSLNVHDTEKLRMLVGEVASTFMSMEGRVGLFMPRGCGVA